MHDRDGLLLKKGGKLYRYRWNKRYQKYTGKNVSNVAPYYLMEPCALDENVTLKDIFLLIKKDIELYKIIIGNWVKEITEEAFSKAKVPAPDLGMKYLQLSWDLEAKTSGEWTEAPVAIFPGFMGVGPSEENPEHPTHWGVDFLHVKTILNLPLKLNNEMTITEYPESGKITDYVTKRYPNPEYSLLQILYGIIWELTWHGPPEARDKRNKELTDTVNKIKSGKVKLIPMEEVFSELRKDKEGDNPF